jgi:leucyl aminopeptidase
MVKVTVDTRKPKGITTVVGVFQEEKEEKAILTDEFGKALKGDDFKAKLREPKLIFVEGEGVLMVGLGKKSKYGLEATRKAVAAGCRFLRRNRRLAVDLFRDDKGTAQAATEAAMLSLYEFRRYKTGKMRGEEPKTKVEEVVLVTSKKHERTVKKGVEMGKLIAEATILARDLVNTPANDKSPAMYAKYVKKMVKKHGIKCKVMTKRDMEKMKMGALLSVAQGSTQEPRMVVLEYGKGKNTVAIVGKGITFDSGGLTLKPRGYMEDMKMDMGGSAVVMATMIAAARLKLPVRVVGIMPLSENMPGGGAIKPGDIVTSYSGKTIEILNTDAEGRLILADALAYSARFKPKATVDVATLTGACVVALGHVVTGLVTNDEKLEKNLRESGERTYERVWPLPLVDEFKKEMRGELADVKNVAASNVGAGTITAAAFLSNFVEGPWAHLDIAGTAWSHRDADYYTKGATGNGVRLLVDFLENWKG